MKPSRLDTPPDLVPRPRPASGPGPVEPRRGGVEISGVEVFRNRSGYPLAVQDGKNPGVVLMTNWIDGVSGKEALRMLRRDVEGFEVLQEERRARVIRRLHNLELRMEQLELGIAKRREA